jgi:hypothetical protein
MHEEVAISPSDSTAAPDSATPEHRVRVRRATLPHSPDSPLSSSSSSSSSLAGAAARDTLSLSQTNVVPANRPTSSSAGDKRTHRSSRRARGQEKDRKDPRRKKKTASTSTSASQPLQRGLRKREKKKRQTIGGDRLTIQAGAAVHQLRALNMELRVTANQQQLELRSAKLASLALRSAQQKLEGRVEALKALVQRKNEAIAVLLAQQTTANVKAKDDESAELKRPSSAPAHGTPGDAGGCGAVLVNGVWVGRRRGLTREAVLEAELKRQVSKHRLHVRQSRADHSRQLRSNTMLIERIRELQAEHKAEAAALRQERDDAVRECGAMGGKRAAAVARRKQDKKRRVRAKVVHKQHQTIIASLQQLVRLQEQRGEQQLGRLVELELKHKALDEAHSALLARSSVSE